MEYYTSKLVFYEQEGTNNHRRFHVMDRQKLQYIGLIVWRGNGTGKYVLAVNIGAEIDMTMLQTTANLIKKLGRRKNV